jgi:hypothetical protein
MTRGGICVGLKAEITNTTFERYEYTCFVIQYNSTKDTPLVYNSYRCRRVLIPPYCSPSPATT